MAGKESQISLRVLLLGCETSPWEPTLASARALARGVTLLFGPGAEKAMPPGVDLLPLPDPEDEAAAINRALELQREDWALLLWSGEIIHTVPPDLASLLAPQENLALWASIVSPTLSTMEARLVRKGVRFQYPVWPEPIMGPGETISGLEIGRSVRDIDVEALQRRLWRLPEGHPHRLYHSIEIALVLGRLQEIPELVGALEEAEGGRLSVPHGDAYFVRFLALLMQDQVEQARDALDRGLEVFPGSPDLAFGQVMLRALRFLEVAEGTRDPSHPFWYQVTTTRHMVPLVREFLASLGLEVSGQQ